MGKTKKLLIIDGNSILNRAYYGIRPLTAPDGTPTNAVYGFLNIMLKYLEEETPDYVCVAFDVKEKTFRHKKYELYKAQRKLAPDDFIVQIPLIKEVLGKMNCLCLEKPGYEADDIIGTISAMCERENVECKILTGDKDDLQLCSDKTTVKLVITRMGKTDTTDFGKPEFVEKYGIDPVDFIDVKALMGDSSDNIPGVKGIGEKTALALVQKYGKLDKIYENIEALETALSVKKKLNEGKESAYLSYELAEIDRNVPIEFNLEDAKKQEFNAEELASVFVRLNFTSFIRRLGLTDSANKSAESADVISGEGEKVDFDELLTVAETVGKVAYFRTTEELYIKPFGGDKVLYSKTDLDKQKAFFADSEIKKVGYDIKEDMVALSDYGIEAQDGSFESMSFDVMLAAYILEPNLSEYSLDGLCIKYLNVVLKNKPEDAQISMLDSTDGDDASDKICKAIAIERLADIMDKKLTDNGQDKLYYDIELPLTEVLAQLQVRGMYVEGDALAEFGTMLEERIEKLRDEIYNMAGEEFNINSPKQLGVILFEKLNLPYGRKNKSGKYSTNVDVLEKLRGEYKIADAVFEYRRLTKLMATYVTGLRGVINEKTGRIHSHFNQTVTNTGRLSSTEPNLQNIPVRTELGREIRKMFAAEKEGWRLIDADYSQIELRVLAHIADDETMKKAFKDGEDIHTQTAANVFGVDVKDVTSQMRSRAKAVNFGIVYGIGAFSLARDIGTSRKEAQEYIDEYLKHYCNVAEYMEKTIEDAKNNGYIRTLLGRRRYMPELSSGSHNVRAFGERVAMNAPIQGSAADIIKIAMVNVWRRLKTEGLRTKLVLQVHDELIVEAPVEEAEKAARILKEEMENAYELSVPLKVDMNTGKTWYDTK